MWYFHDLRLQLNRYVNKNIQSFSQSVGISALGESFNVNTDVIWHQCSCTQHALVHQLCILEMGLCHYAASHKSFSSEVGQQVKTVTSII